MFVYLVAFLVSVQTARGFWCKDQANNDVDWFMALKMPIHSDESTSGGSLGHGFYYMDINKKKFLPSPVAITENNQAIAYTLQQLYSAEGEAEVFYLMYNDEPAVAATLLEILMQKETNDSAKASVQFGHTKGVLLFNKENGFWLVHSVPRFPPPNKYAYPTSGATYGQNLLCMSFQYDQLSKIATQLYYNHPDVYASALPTDIAQEIPNLANVVAKKYKTGTPTSSVIDLNTEKGLVFKSYAKTHEFNKDLYEGLVAPDLASGLNVETWKRGSEVPLTCPPPKYPVYDVQYLKALTSPEYKYTNDHSKYAVSRSQTQPYVCNGDINRMTSQYKRGGGTVCFRDAFVWGEYNGLLVSENSC